jgi:dolichol-phosphate mannosyltransferase
LSIVLPTFNEGQHRGRHSNSRRLNRWAVGNVLWGLGLVLNILILNGLFNWLGMNRYAANAIAILVVTIGNFTLNLKLGWRTASLGDKMRATQPGDA